MERMKTPNKYKRLERCSKEELIEKMIVRDKHCDDLKGLLDKGLKKYKELEEEIKRLNIIIENTKIEQEADRKHIEELEEENKKLREEVKDLVERNIELDKKYMLVLTENEKLKEWAEENSYLRAKLRKIEGELEIAKKERDEYKERRERGFSV